MSAENQKYAVAFPGREAFYQGLCPSFYRQYRLFRDIYDAASNYLREDLYHVSYEDGSLKPDLHTVCLITHCYGMYSVLMQDLPRPSASLGFSQGEFTAAAAAGAMKFPEILGLVRRLESLIIDNGEITGGAMARVVELDREELQRCCLKADPRREEVKIAIYLSPDQNIISGSRQGVAEVARLAHERGARWVIPLNSGGAFHSPHCSAILERSGPVFDEYRFTDAEYNVYSCTSGSCSTDAGDIKERLSRQIAMPVLWDRIVLDLKSAGILKMLELGPGSTVSGNSRIICSEIEYRWLNHAEEIKELVGAA